MKLQVAERQQNLPRITADKAADVISEMGTAFLSSASCSILKSSTTLFRQECNKAFDRVSKGGRRNSLRHWLRILRHAAKTLD